MTIKNNQEIEIMREGGKILAKIINSLIKQVKPGIKTQDLDILALNLMTKYKTKSAFKDFNGYPANICISINEEIVHGLPSPREIIKHDVVSIDCGIKYKGFCLDAATTITAGKTSKKITKLINITEKSLKNAIKLIKPGIKLGTIQAEIEKYIKTYHFGLVTELTGHGIGKNLQEEPAIPNYGKPNTGLTLKPRMTFCLEPMVTLGNGQIKLKNDGWTIISSDNTCAAHFEHTILVTADGYEILTK